MSYEQMNEAADSVGPGSDGLQFFPFGNGAERMLDNKNIGARFMSLDFNRHTQPHMIRAVLEGIAFSFRYGLDILRENAIHPTIIRSHHTNLFLSRPFAQIFADTTNTILEINNQQIIPKDFKSYNDHYTLWKQSLEKIL